MERGSFEMQGDTETTEWARARELFLDLADRTPPERERELARLEASDPRLSTRVRELLAHDPGVDAEPVSDAGELFGPYETVRRIAVGGMGEVLLGRRSDGEFEREVAIKRLRFGGGREVVQRFLRERQTLARLDHEYIARLLDGGTSDAGEPYLVLEFVQGRHIDDYCREEGLDVRARVELFRRVLEAVAYAHERGVIHRDLKPSNILVRDDGQPRLLDFGIARAAEKEAEAVTLTGTGQRLFTPEFASPEQVRGEEITAATDVFALGVLLYLLLTDASPWGEAPSLFVLERKILEHDPSPPSRRLAGRKRRLVAGDLDTITLRCLAKDPNARFASVATLGEELDRHLQGFPIRTRPTSIVGRLVRRGRRNPGQALAAVVLVVALVSAGLAWRSDRTASSRGAELVETLSGRLDHARNLRIQDRNPDAAAELRAILASVESLPGAHELEVEVVAELSMTLLRTGEPEESLALVERGLALLPDDPAQQARTRATLLLAEVSGRRAIGDVAGASAAVSAAYAYTTRHLERGDVRRLEAIEAVATEPGLSLDERLLVADEGIREAREKGRPHDGGLGSLVTLKGFWLTEKGDFEAALVHLDEALAIDRWNHGEGHGDVAIVRFARGNCFLSMGRLDEAVTELEAALGIFETMGHTDMAAQARFLLDRARTASDS